jgi:hypothetical protein
LARGVDGRLPGEHSTAAAWVRIARARKGRVDYLQTVWLSHGSDMTVIPLMGPIGTQGH